MSSNLEILTSVCLGLALAAACGLRVFLPMTVLSAAGLLGWVELSESFAWIGTWPALMAFVVATLAEVTAFYVPALDNLLDSAAIPLSAVAGTVASMATLVDVGPLAQWTLPLIAGAGVAATTQLVTTKARAVSTLGTAGLANPVLATAEAAGATTLSVMAIVAPLLAAVGALVLMVGMVWLSWRAARGLARLLGKGQPPAAAAAPPDL